MKRANIDNTLIVIPVYDSGLYLEKLFDRIESVCAGYNVLCVDDGSVDNSRDILKERNINFVSHDRNRGKGHALKTGMMYAKNNGYKFAITMDSDLQHDPRCIPNFFTTQNVEDADLVIGFRDFGLLKQNTMPFMRVMSNTMTSGIVSCVSKRNILDSQSGFRMYNLELFDENEITTDRYQMETEILFSYIHKNAVVSHVEIPIVYGGEKSHISHLRDIVNFVKVVIKEV